MAEVKKVHSAVTVFVLILIVLSIGYLESRKSHSGSVSVDDNQQVMLSATNARTEAKAAQYPLAYEISTPDGFINVDDLRIADLIGKKVVLVDFWTYSCINCQRTLPYLNEWHDKYADDGLVIVGVHTPEFDFEKDFENVSRAVEKYGIEYPVVLDNDFSTWTSYQNRFWPRKYLVDIDGFIVYDHIGEGGYEETEEKIVELLNERAEVLGSGTAVTVEAGSATTTTAFNQILSPEMYFGSSRAQNLANSPDESCASGPCEYSYAGGIQPNTYQLSGTWNTTPEYAELTSETGGFKLYFSAGQVHMVAGAASASRAEVYLDGVKVSEQNAGRDVIDGVVTIDAQDLYNLIDLKGEYGEHMLELRFLDSGVEAFTFTFG